MKQSAYFGKSGFTILELIVFIVLLVLFFIAMLQPLVVSSLKSPAPSRKILR